MKLVTLKEGYKLKIVWSLESHTFNLSLNSLMEKS